MEVVVQTDYELVHELRLQSNLSGVPLCSEQVTSLLGPLVDEAHTNAILADCLPGEQERLRVRITPEFETEPLVKAVRIDLFTGDTENAAFSQAYSRGPWTRQAQQKTLQLREEGSLGANETAVEVLAALKRADVSLEPPPLQPPTIRATTLESCGIRNLGEGSLVPDRPVLINARFVDEAIRQCEEADVLEAGGAAIGQIVQLDQPLPGTETRVVTILSSMLVDSRHVGEATRFHFKPEALLDAQQLCELRGMGERVLTVFHTHGWSNKCGNCNQNANCPLAEARPSLQDYQLLATLFPAKSTLMPIAGRKLGAEGRRPLLQVYAWRLGEMRPLRWQRYLD